jgi:hypothetical protein
MVLRSEFCVKNSRFFPVFLPPFEMLRGEKKKEKKIKKKVGTREKTGGTDGRGKLIGFISWRNLMFHVGRSCPGNNIT